MNISVWRTSGKVGPRGEKTGCRCTRGLFGRPHGLDRVVYSCATHWGCRRDPGARRTARRAGTSEPQCVASPAWWMARGPDSAHIRQMKWAHKMCGPRRSRRRGNSVAARNGRRSAAGASSDRGGESGRSEGKGDRWVRCGQLWARVRGCHGREAGSIQHTASPDAGLHVGYNFFPHRATFRPPQLPRRPVPCAPHSCAPPPTGRPARRPIPCVPLPPPHPTLCTAHLLERLCDKRRNDSGVREVDEGCGGTVHVSRLVPEPAVRPAVEQRVSEHVERLREGIELGGA